MPLQRRLPKRGFNNKFRTEYTIVSLSQLERFEPNQEITPEVLIKAGIAKAGQPVKVLANGELTKPLTIKVDKVSGQAKERIEKAGGTVVSDAPASE